MGMCTAALSLLRSHAVHTAIRCHASTNLYILLGRPTTHCCTMSASTCSTMRAESGPTRAPSLRIPIRGFYTNTEVLQPSRRSLYKSALMMAQLKIDALEYDMDIYHQMDMPERVQETQEKLAYHQDRAAHYRMMLISPVCHVHASTREQC